MPLSALALVLAAALLHALWNIVAKRAGGNHHFAFVSVLFTVVIWAPVAVAFGALNEALRWGAREWLVLAASALVHVLYFTVLLTGYRKADLTVVYPVARGSGPLLASVGALAVLGEPLTLLGGVGVLAVCGGVFLIAGGPRILRAGPEAPGHAQALAGVRWGAATGLLIAAYTVIDGYAVKVLLIGPVIVDYVGNLLRVPLLAPGAWRDPAGFRAACRGQWRPAVVIAVMGPLAYVLVLYAVQLAPLSHVAPAREVSMLFAALIGGRLLGEGDRGWRIVGACCIAAGVIALATA
ncbi:MAG TPA: DMT family transporter [Burkholderiaceae bacterium]|nr:DMT family transporter [Burkholderiaceae bacterium]